MFNFFEVITVVYICVMTETRTLTSSQFLHKDVRFSSSLYKKQQSHKYEAAVKELLIKYMKLLDVKESLI
jgi:hypothetical protein